MFIIYKQILDKIEEKLFQPIILNWTFNKDEAEAWLKDYKENDEYKNNKYYIREI